jgi:hypothetical protein
MACAGGAMLVGTVVLAAGCSVQPQQPPPEELFDSATPFPDATFDASQLPFDANAPDVTRRNGHDAARDAPQIEPGDAQSGDVAFNCSTLTRIGAETDVGCGGPSCPACAVGKHCLVNSDCANTVCDVADAGTLGVCEVPSCHDGMKDGQETDSDCGGPNCPACGDGLHCVTTTDCTSLVCTGLVCQAPSCTDGVKNGTETDVDCGSGMCPSCIVGKQCVAATDCTSDICTMSTCNCPPNMVIVPTNLPAGGDYCVDALEVTYSEYYAFWNSNPGLINQPSFCSWNSTFTPANGWPPDLNTMDTATYNGGNPVNWVNWCQAYGYCAQQGKRLCGKIGGGTNATADSANYLKSQWFNACSADGVNTYPYGSTYQAARCNDSSVDGGGAPWPELNVNGQLVNDQCQGGASGLYQMSGDVAEWEDSCSGSTGATDTCLLRGGSYNSSASGLTCATAVPTARNYQGGDSGFRCCL